MGSKTKIGIVICDRYHRYGIKVIAGTHPIAKKYLDMHTHLGTWKDSSWKPFVAPTMSDEVIRESYD